jgi:hypothetical protein
MADPKSPAGAQNSARRRRWGDRYDGRRLRAMDPMNIIIPYVMPSRTGAANSFHGRAFVREAERYIRQKRVEGLKGFGMLHFFISLYVRIVSQRPGVNRFISGQRLFARHNIEIVLTVKKELSVSGQETTIKITCLPADTAADIHRRLAEALEEARRAGDSNDVDNLARLLTKAPGFALKGLVWLLKKLDYFGLMPKAFHRASPFHASLFVTDLGSINLPPVHHHLYDFGNCPLFLAFGPKQKDFAVDQTGQVTMRRFLDYSLTLDERICDGFYFSAILRMVEDIFKRPEQLDTPPEAVTEDID